MACTMFVKLKSANRISSTYYLYSIRLFSCRFHVDPSEDECNVSLHGQRSNCNSDAVHYYIIVIYNLRLLFLNDIIFRTSFDDPCLQICFREFYNQSTCLLFVCIQIVYGKNIVQLIQGLYTRYSDLPYAHNCTHAHALRSGCCQVIETENVFSKI